MAQCKIVNTRYLDNNALEVLGLKDNVYWMLDMVGWVEFMKLKSSTYIHITLAIISSVKANILSEEGCDQGCITFHLFNTEHRLKLE